jgi:hypothetical protein
MSFKVKKWEDMTRKEKIAGVVILLTIVGIFLNLFSGPKQPAKQEQVAPTAIPTQVKTINYEVVKSWEIPNGGFGKVIVISPQNFNEADMTLLGEKLKADTKNDRNAFIFIFDDKKAAEMRDRLPSTTNPPNETEQDYYDKHFVGDYSRNINSGYHQFTIYFDGVIGTNQKTIKY